MKKNYDLIKDVICLVESFEMASPDKSNQSIDDFIGWIVRNNYNKGSIREPEWEGKENNRSPESVISTLLVHMNRYAKSYSKSAMLGSDFTTQEDFIFLINLRAFGKMTKMELIKKNVQEKSVGIQIINRLLKNGWVGQMDCEKDKRSTYLYITERGIEALDAIMSNVRVATKIVAGDLDYDEKMELIRLLNKLNQFHKNIYDEGVSTEKLLEKASKTINT